MGGHFEEESYITAKSRESGEGRARTRGKKRSPVAGVKNESHPRRVAKPPQLSNSSSPRLLASMLFLRFRDLPRDPRLNLRSSRFLRLYAIISASSIFLPVHVFALHNYRDN